MSRTIRIPTLVTLTALWAAPALVAPALSAQTESKVAANRFVPADSCVVLRFAAPAKWRERFATTQVAKLGQSQTLSPLLERASQAFESGLQELRANGMFDADLLERFVNEYEGDVLFSLQVDFDGLRDAMQYGEMPPLSFVLALTPDGAFDLGALATAFEQLVEKTAPAGDELRDLTVGDLRLRRTDNGPDDLDATLPTMVDGHLVMVAGMDLEKHAERLLASDKRFDGDTGDRHPLHLHVGLESAVKSLMDAASEDAEGAPFDPAEMLGALGLKALRDMTMTVDAEDTHVTGEFRLGMGTKERGILAAFVQSQQKPRLLGSVPANAEAWSVSATSLVPVFDTARTIWTGLEGFVPMSFGDVMDAFTEATKVRLKEDLIDQLGAEMLVVQDPESLHEASLDADEEVDLLKMISGSVYGIALRDGRAFGESLEKALRARGLHAGRKTEDYGSVAIHRMRVAGLVEIEYVVADDVLLVGVGGGEGTQRALRAILDTRKAGDGGVPQAVATEIAALPGGWNGVSTTPVAVMFQAIATGFEAGSENLGDEAKVVAEVMRGIGGELRRLGIATMVSATYVDEKGLASRFRW